MCSLHDTETVKDIRNRMERILYSDRRYYGEYHNKMTMVLPLMMLPYLKTARDEMNKLLLECLYKYLSLEVANLISGFIFMYEKDFSVLYDTEKIKMENLTVKCLLLVTKFRHLYL